MLHEKVINLLPFLSTQTAIIRSKLQSKTLSPEEIVETLLVAGSQQKTSTLWVASPIQLCAHGGALLKKIPEPCKGLIAENIPDGFNFQI